MTNEQPGARSDGGSGAGASTVTKTLTRVATALAIVLIGSYLIALAYMAVNADAEDGLWLRRSDLLGGLEALAFAAAGAVFGTTVQRQATDKAEANAAENKARADQNERDAGAGRAVVAAAQAQLDDTGRAPAPRIGAAGGLRAEAEADFARADFARELVATWQRYR